MPPDLVAQARFHDLGRRFPRTDERTSGVSRTRWRYSRWKLRHTFGAEHRSRNGGNEDSLDTLDFFRAFRCSSLASALWWIGDQR